MDTIVLALTTDFAIVPNDHFQEKNPEKHLWIAGQTEFPERTNHNFLAAGNFHLVYSLPDYISKFVKSYFQQAVYQHSAASLITYLMPESANKILPQVYAYINPGIIEILIIEKGRLIFYNAFEYMSSEDMLYFIMLVYRQFNLDAGNMSLTLLGEIEMNSNFVSLASRYIHTITLAERPTVSSFSPAFNALPGSYYFNLFCSK